jgi:hypothetical protein
MIGAREWIVRLALFSWSVEGFFDGRNDSGISSLAGDGEGGVAGLRNSGGIDAVIEEQGDDFDSSAGGGLVERGAPAGAENLGVRAAFEQGLHNGGGVFCGGVVEWGPADAVSAGGIGFAGQEETDNLRITAFHGKMERGSSR